MVAETLKAHDPALAHASDPPRRCIKDHAAVATARVGTAEHEHCRAEIPEVFGCDAKVSPGGVNVGPELLHPGRATIDGALGPSDNRWTNFHRGIKNLAPASKSRSANAARNVMATSTFSCDIAYSDSPAASKACALSRWCVARTTFPSRSVQTCQKRSSTTAPLPFPRPHWWTRTITLFPPSTKSSHS